MAKAKKEVTMDAELRALQGIMNSLDETIERMFRARNNFGHEAEARMLDYIRKRKGWAIEYLAGPKQ